MLIVNLQMWGNQSNTFLKLYLFQVMIFPVFSMKAPRNIVLIFFVFTSIHLLLLLQINQ